VVDAPYDRIPVFVPEGAIIPFGPAMEWSDEKPAELVNQKSPDCRVIVTTFGGNPYATPWLDKVDALVHCWYLGSESGNALANVLTGKVNPSGKLPVTFARRYNDYPYVRFGQRAYPGISEQLRDDRAPRSQVYYDEGIFVGYRGFEKNKTSVQFPFGFGLSYTTFAMTSESLNQKQDSVIIAVDITNIGRVAGKETAQVYVSAPNSKRKDEPLKELKAFAKTRLLQPGERETLMMAIPLNDLRYWDEQTHQWKFTAGKYTFHIGSSSADIKHRLSVTL